MKKFWRYFDSVLNYCLGIGLIVLLAVLLIGSCEGEDKDAETPNNAVWDSNSVEIEEPDIITIDKAVWLHISFSDANIDSIDKAASELRKMDTRNAKEVIDIEVIIGDETHIASFEDLFEWMGFKDKKTETPTIALAETNVVPLIEIATYEPSYNITFWDDDEIGRLDWSSGEMKFSGDIGKSVEAFFKYLKTMVDGYIRTELNKDSNDGI